MSTKATPYIRGDPTDIHMFTCDFYGVSLKFMLFYYNSYKSRPIIECTACFLHIFFFTVSMVIKFGNDESSLVHSLWDENVLKYCSEMILDSRLVNEVGKGLQLGSQLELPKEHTFGSTHMADFIVKAKTMRSLAAVE